MEKAKRLLKVAAFTLLFISCALSSYAKENVYWDLEEYLEGCMDAYFNAKYPRAIDLGKDALYVAERKFGPDHTNVAAILVNLAAFYKAAGEYPEAEKYYKRALKVFETSLGLDNPYAAKTWDAIGDNYLARRKYTEADSSYKNSQEIWNKNLGGHSPYGHIVQGHQGALYKERRKYKEAEEALGSSIQATVQNYGGEGHPVLIRLLFDMGKVFEAQSKEDEAERYYRYGWGVFKGNFYLEDPSVNKAMDRIKSEADKLWEKRNEPIYKRLLDVNDLYIGPWHPEAPRILDILPSFYLKQMRYLEAENIYEDSLEIMLSNLGYEHLNVARVMDNMAKFYRKMGKENKASEATEKANLIRRKDRY